jgi:hypothetical protein
MPCFGRYDETSAVCYLCEDDRLCKAYMAEQELEKSN